MENKKEKFFTKKRVKEFLIINFGVILMAFAYSFFVDPHKLIVGGVSGLSTLLSRFEFLSFLHFELFGESFGTSQIILLFLNIVLLVFALLFVNKSFFLNSLYVSLAYPVYSLFFALIYKKFFGDYFIDMTIIQEISKGIIETIQGKLGNIDIDVATKMLTNILQIGPYIILIIFGSVISSIGIGLALKNGSSTGGVDILQKIFLDKFKIPFSASLLMIDGTVVVLSAIYFNNIFVLLYGAIYVLISGVIIDMIVFNGFNSRAVNIITSKPEIVKEAVIKRFDRTVTEITGIGAYSKEEKKILLCVMGNSEYYHLKALIEEIDPKAFIYTTRASEVHGEGFSYGKVTKKDKKWKIKS